MTDSPCFAWDFPSFSVKTHVLGNPFILSKQDSWGHLVEMVKSSSACFISTHEYYFQIKEVRGMLSPCKCPQMFPVEKGADFAHSVLLFKKALTAFIQTHTRYW